MFTEQMIQETQEWEKTGHEVTIANISKTLDILKEHEDDLAYFYIKPVYYKDGLRAELESASVEGSLEYLRIRIEFEQEIS